jgi:hypothetical protein
MARLVDPSMLPGNYALSALSETYEPGIVAAKKQIIESLRN